MKTTYHIAWNQDRTVGVICEDPQMAYELRKGAHNTLGIVSDEFVEAWAEMTALDNCTTEEIEVDFVASEPCPDCGRKIMKRPEPATGFIAKCGRRLVDITECRADGKSCPESVR